VKHLFKIEDFGFSGFYTHNKADIDESNGAKIILLLPKSSDKGSYFRFLICGKLTRNAHPTHKNWNSEKSNNQSIDMVLPH
jgi:hypothetical protein